MDLLNLLSEKTKNTRPTDRGIIEVGVTAKDLTSLLSGEINEVVIKRDNISHVITKSEKVAPNGLNMFKASMNVEAPYSMVVAPAINGQKARVYFVNKPEKINGNCYEGTCLVLSEENASKLYSNGVCEQSKDRATWKVIADESRQNVTFDGVVIKSVIYRCKVLEDKGVDFNELVERI